MPSVYKYHDDLMIPHEFDEVPEIKQRPQAITKAAIVETTILSTGEPQKPAQKEPPVVLPPGLTPIITEFMEPSNPKRAIRSVPKEEIDRKRGTREHKARNQLTIEDVIQDYNRVGVKITKSEAEKIHTALVKFTNGTFTDMRKAFMKFRKGETLTQAGTTMLNEYTLCIEYARIAPVYKTEGKEIYRGIKRDGGDYANRLLALKVGNTFDLELASSISSEMMKSANFAGYDGIMFHVVDGDIKDAPSIRGLSIYENEYEVLVDDRFWKVTKVLSDDETEYHFHHIWLERQKGK